MDDVVDAALSAIGIGPVQDTTYLRDVIDSLQAAEFLLCLEELAEVQLPPDVEFVTTFGQLRRVVFESRHAPLVD